MRNGDANAVTVEYFVNYVSSYFQYTAHGVKASTLSDKTEILFPKIQLTKSREEIISDYTASVENQSDSMDQFIANNPRILRGK